MTILPLYEETGPVTPHLGHLKGTSWPNVLPMCTATLSVTFPILYFNYRYWLLGKFKEFTEILIRWHFLVLLLE